MTDFKKLLETIAKSIVEHPDEVIVSESVHDNEINLVLGVSEEDMGMVIGTQGKIAKAIRTVMRAAAISEGKKVNVEIS